MLRANRRILARFGHSVNQLLPQKQPYLRNRVCVRAVQGFHNITMQTYSTGVLYAILGGVFLSTGGLLVRFVDQASPWTILFYRSLVFTVTVLLFLFIRNRQAFKQQFLKIKLIDLLASFLLALGFICYLLSLFNTSVANTVLLLSTGPVAAGVLAYFVLGEAIRALTWAAMVLAFAGVCVMVSGGINANDVVGIIYAFGAVLSFACFVVLLRYLGPQRDMMAPTALAGVIAAIMCVPMMLPLTESIVISGRDIFVAVCLGSFQVGFGFIFITLSAKSVPAAQIPLLALSETALSPIWVWLAVDEVPARNTIIGGAIVLIAVLLQGYAGIRAARQNPDTLV